ncbi:MAG: PKD domain-containing protein [Actinomycetota bacterium]
MRWLFGWIRGDGLQVMSVGTVIAVVAAMMAAVGWGYEAEPLASRSLTDSTVWVTTPEAGLVHPLDATVGDAGPPMRLDGARGAALSTVQAGSDGYVINSDEGTVRFIDASLRQFGATFQLDDEGALSFFASPTIAWAYASNQLQRLTPGAEMQSLGQPIPIVADGDDAVMGSAGEMLLPDERAGELARVTVDGSVDRVSVADAEHDLVVRLVDQTPVVLDRDVPELVVLDDDGDALVVKSTCRLELTSRPVPISGNGIRGRFAVLSEDPGSLTVVDLDSCQSRNVDMSDAATEFGTPVIAGGVVYVPNFTDRVVELVDITVDLDAMQAQRTRELEGVEGEFELIVDNELVVFNDPDTASAGAVFPSGAVNDPGKFSLGDSGVEVRGAPRDEGEEPDPAGPDTSDVPAINCGASALSVVVGDTVTLTAVPVSGQIAAVESYQFTIDGATSDDDDGTIDFEPDEAGTVETSVVGLLSGGGATSAASCGEIEVSASSPTDQPDPDRLRCASSVGRSAQVNTEVTFFANFGTGEAPTSYQWDFDDGGVSSEPEPAHTFDEQGRRNVTLEVEFPSGRGDTASCPLTITDGAPDLTADFTWDPPQIVVGEAVTFTNLTLNPDAITAVSWSFENGQPATGSGATETVTWDEEGTYTVELMVTNADNISDAETKTVTVGRAAPQAPPEVTVNAIGNVVLGQTVTLAYSVNAGNPVASSARWQVYRSDDLGNETLEIELAGSPNRYTIPDHRGGTYRVELVVSDSQGRSTTGSTSFRAIPALNPSILATPNPALVATSISFEGSANSSSVESWNWTFGDGNSASGQNVSHSFSRAGIYTVTLSVTSAGATDSATRSVEVLDGGSTVPDVTGQPLAAARSALEGAGLAVGSVTTACNVGSPLDEVFGQSVVGQLVAQGTPIDLQVSDGSSWVVPTLSLTSTPEDFGLGGRLTIVEQLQNTTDRNLDGQYVGQSVAAGTEFCGQQTVQVFRGVFTPDVRLTCPASGTYGQPVTCTAVDNVNGGVVDWGGGVTTPIPVDGSASHSYTTVGSQTPVLVHDGVSIPANAVMIEPDLTVSCTGGGGTVYKLEPGWAYARDANGDPEVEPVGGAPGAPCTANSAALTALGGSATWVVSPTGNASAAGSASGSGASFSGAECCQFAWAGVQPAQIAFTITVNGRAVNRSTPMYLSGCG